MSKHTAGPCEVEHSEGISIRDSFGSRIAGIGFFKGRFGVNGKISTNEAEANARLIAAAPELLETLKLADALLSGANMNKALVEKKVKAAIAKARGEA